MSLEELRLLIRAGGKWYVRWPVRILIVLALLFIAFLPYAHEIAGEGRVVPEYRRGIRAQVTAELVAIHVDEGDLVEAGALLATMTDRDVGTDVATTLAELDAAIAEHKLLLSGLLPEEIAVLERDVDRYQIEVEYQKAEVARMERLVEEEIQSQTELDQQRRLRDSAEQRLEAAQQTLARGRIGARSEQIAAAQAKIEGLRAQLKFHEQQAGLLQVRTRSRVECRLRSFVTRQVAQEGELICVVESTDLVVEIEADERRSRAGDRGHGRRSASPRRCSYARKGDSRDPVGLDERDVQDYTVMSDRAPASTSGPGLATRHARAGLRETDSAVEGSARIDGYGRIKVGEKSHGAVSRPFVSSSGPKSGLAS
jgi:hypothetical protein